MSNLSSILKWAWQAHFWSHRPVTLQNCTFSEYVQMILLALFKISYNKKFEKNPKAFMSISVACPCLNSWTPGRGLRVTQSAYF
jgi:hypothetical protein